MTLNASTILDSAATTLLDVAHRTWSADELLGYCRTKRSARSAAARPADFYVVEEDMVLQAGIVQALPDNGILLIDIPRNSQSLPSGVLNPSFRVITQVDKMLQDEADRFWPIGTPQTEVEHYTFDPRNPRRFTVYLPQRRHRFDQHRLRGLRTRGDVRHRRPRVL